jgi:hypothetical protein
MFALPGTFTLQTTAIAGAVALVLGLAGGGYVAHAFYAPRLQAEKLKVSNLGEKITEQNNAVHELQAAGERRDVEAKAAVDAAALKARTAEARAQQLLKMKPPAPGVDACAAASDLIRLELGK